MSRPSTGRRQTYRVVVMGAVLGGTILILLGCHSGPSAPSGTDCWFSGFTEADADGNIISEDPGDWCFGGGFDSFALFGYPNPAPGITKIAYSIPTSGAVRIRMVAQGCIHVRTLLDTEVDAGAAGFVVWDGRTDFGGTARPGLYRCLLEADGLQCYGDILLTDP